MGDGRPRAARAELDDPFQRDVGQSAREGGRETGDVRVVSRRAAVLEDDGVDRAECGGLRSEIVEMRDDELFAGVRDVQPVEADVACGPYEIADGLRRNAEGVDVDQPVQTAQPLPVGLPLVQGGAEGGADSEPMRPMRYEVWDTAGLRRRGVGG